MKILIACEFSGIVRDAFAAKGHDVWSCDLLPTERPGNHIQGDVLQIINDGWDMMIAHPPCTYLSSAGARWLYPGGNLDLDRYKLGLEAKQFFMQLWHCNIPRICIENPISLTVFRVPIHSQEIQPYQFGHPVTKKTRLWLKQLPELTPSNLVDSERSFCPSNTSRKIRSQYGTAKRGNDRKNRSVTFSGIAHAMADQWG